MQRERLTPERIRRFTCPEGTKQVFLWDETAPRLAVRATAGAKAFIFEAKLDRRTIRVTIGDVRAWNLDDARTEARRLQTEIDQGNDPREQKRERIAAAEGPLVIVDYAHTPDALEQTLRALRRHCPGRLWCVFGCGGDRDRAKRPLMGRIAWEHADELLITSDNPRSEDPNTIIHEMRTGITTADQSRLFVNADRKEAIRMAVGLARPGDVVLVAGKGHETYQEVKGVKHPFDDAAVLRETLELMHK